MKNSWIEDIFGCRKPIIGMCHLNALPGDPSFDQKQGMKGVLEWAHRDLLALQGLPALVVQQVLQAQLAGQVHLDLLLPRCPILARQ